MATALAGLILSLMLFYHGRGSRDYHRQPMPLRRRLHWECAAILSGRAAPTLAEAAPLPSTPALWVFPPGHLHGWASSQAGTCRVCILHLTGIPRLIADAADSAGHLHLPLDPARRRIIDRLDRRLAELLTARPAASEIAAELARGELGILLCPLLAPSASNAGEDAAHLLKRALAWLDSHLHEGAGIDQAARAVAVSPAHLRRLAHAVAGRSPRDLLTQLRLERACDLLRQTDDSLAAIAWACGYADAVALSKAFLRHHGQRPGRWRTAARQALLSHR